MSLIVTHTEPQRDEIVEQRVRAALQQLDSLLDVRWYPYAAYNPRTESYEGRSALVCRWPIGDKRYEMIRSGEIGDDPYDILGYFTDDMQNADSPAVSVDAIESKVIDLLASADNQRVGWRDRMLKTVENNRRVRAEARRVQNDMLHDLASYHREAALGIPIVAVATQIVDNTTESV